MAVTIVATPGAANANSYVTLAEFDVYLDTLLNNTIVVDATTEENRKRALVQATRVLDAVMCWTGTAASSTQALNWPRSGMLSKNGYAIADNVIPQELKNAQMELARLLMLSDVTAPNDADVQGITKIKAGPVELQFRDEINAKRIPDSVFMLLPTSWICLDWENVVDLPEDVYAYFDSLDVTEAQE